MAALAPRSCAKFNDEISILLKKDKSEVDAVLEFLGHALGFRGECGEVIASVSLPKDRIEKLVAFGGEIRGAFAASVATLRKLARKLRFAQAAAMGRFGRAAAKHIY